MIFLFQIVCVLALVSCGYFARRGGLITAQGTTDLARICIAIIYPALIFVSMTQLSLAELRANYSLPLLAMVIAISGFLLGLLAARILGDVHPATTRAFLFHCLINNYLFLPLPLVLFRFGEKGVALLVFSSVGYEVLLWSLGVVLFTTDLSGWQRIKSLLSPPFVTLITALLFVVLRDLFTWPAPPGWLALAWQTVRSGMHAVGQATIAFSMLVAGSRFAVMKHEVMLGWRVWLVSFIRLVAVPLIMIPVLGLIPMDETARGLLTIVAVMPAAMASVLFSERFGGDTDFIAGGLLLTHLWALVTVPLFLAWAL
ncbi:MAG TPA: AEC family transporter [Kiritimatiellia bacterium]|nr:AEC family transporter [Kiritimatiellia bacterium]